MKTRTLLLSTLLIGGLILAACQRSATTDTVPATQPLVASPDAGQGGTGSGPKGDPTMDALSTQLFSGSTQVAGGGLDSGQVATATASPIPGNTQVVSPTIGVPTLAPVITATPVPAGAACASPYTVKQGDWIYKIARECNLQPQAIIAANPGINPNRLTPGQKLNLPGAAPAPTVAPGATATPQPPAATCKGTYTVKGGDNLFRIAFNCGFTTEQMAARNNIAPPYRIFPGQVLTYP